MNEPSNKKIMVKLIKTKKVKATERIIRKKSNPVKKKRMVIWQIDRLKKKKERKNKNGKEDSEK